MDRSAYVVEGLCTHVAAGSRWRESSLCIIDFETTGRDASTDRILEIGIVCVENGYCTHRYEQLINPGIPVPEESRAIHGITDEMLANAPTFASAWENVMSMLSGRIPVAYNAAFDRAFLLAETQRADVAFDLVAPALDESVVWIDPLVWARELFKYEKGKKLTDMCKRLNITLDNAHRASGDAEAAWRVLVAMATKLPDRYDDLIRLQTQYAERQAAEFTAWRARMRGT